jgi:hypothetical protein
LALRGGWLYDGADEGKREFVGTDLNRLAVVQHKRIENLFPIYIGAVVALLVLDNIADVAAPDDGMAARNQAVICQGYIICCQTANGNLVFVQPILFHLPIGPPENEPGRTLLSAWSNQGRVVCARWLVILKLHTSFPPQPTLLVNSLAASLIWLALSRIAIVPLLISILSYLARRDGAARSIAGAWRVSAMSFPSRSGLLRR